MVKFCKSNKSLVGKTVIITGANAGIGYATAVELAKRGGRIIMACRNLEKANEARKKIIDATDNDNIIIKQVNLESLASVRKFAEDVIDTEEKLHLLINNAGVIQSPNKLTEEGLQFEMAVNYFGPFLLTNLLLDLLKKSTPSRIINVSSVAAKLHFNLKLEELQKHKGFVNMYGKTKLCQIYFTQELAKRLEGTGVTVYSLHPGAVFTDVFKGSFYSWILEKSLRTPEEGAQTTIYVALEEGIEKYNGEHFEDCSKVRTYCTAKNEEKRTKLWEISEELVGLSQK